MNGEKRVKQIHLIIVTGQAQANLIPILQLKPDIIALAISQDMSEKSAYFIKLLRTIADYPESAIMQFCTVPDTGIEQIVDKAMEIEDVLTQQFPESQITYHATGGNKLMTLGFYSVFSAAPHRVVYCDMAHAEIVCVYPEKQPAIALQHVLNIKDALLSMEQTYRTCANLAWQETARQRKEVSKWLGKHAAELDKQGFLGCLNQLVQAAIEQGGRGQLSKIGHPEQFFRQNPRGIWVEALKKLTQYHLCQWDEGRPDCVYFNSLQGAKYIGGQWLEEYTWHIINDLKPAQVLANVEFAESGALKSDIRNEMDCVVAHRNQLLFIECKTLNFKKQSSKDSDILYKLESLGSRAAGLYGTKWLVSARALDAVAIKRAEQYHIDVIYGEDLKKLKDKLKNWMGE